MRGVEITRWTEGDRHDQRSDVPVSGTNHLRDEGRSSMTVGARSEANGSAAGTRLMDGKTVLVTGGTGGIGRATATRLASLGARVGITGRDRARAERAAAAIVRESNNAVVDVFVADMSSQAEVRRLAAEVLSTYPRLDVLINNVGGFWSHRHLTGDGLEHTFALNHLAPFLLTSLLLDRLKASAPARVVTVSSAAQALGKIDFDDLMGERQYSGQEAYNQSKLANVMFTYELARRLAGTGVTATAVHPGMTDTAFSREDPSRVFAPLVKVMRPFMQKPDSGADTPVFLASSPAAADLTGEYFAKRESKRSSTASYDTSAAGRLWRVSADLVGISAD
jgi:retinol dehydrogenase 14